MDNETTADFSSSSLFGIYALFSFFFLNKKGKLFEKCSLQNMWQVMLVSYLFEELGLKKEEFNY